MTSSRKEVDPKANTRYGGFEGRKEGTIICRTQLPLDAESGISNACISAHRISATLQGCSLTPFYRRKSRGLVSSELGLCMQFGLVAQSML